MLTGWRTNTWFTPLLGVTGLAVLAAGLAGSPALADEDTDQTSISVRVTGAITLTDLTASFELTGAPSSQQTDSTSMTVTTNNFAGYTVTVEPGTASFAGQIVGNTDVISAAAVEVSGPVQGSDWDNLAFGTPLLVATKSSASAQNGDTVNNSFRLLIPAVRPDTYTGDLNYVVTTL